MEVNGPGPVHHSNPVGHVRPTQQQASPTAKPAGPVDAVEISSAGRMLEKASQSSPVRAERIAQIKAAIDAGTYETPEKLEAALEKLLDEFERQGRD
jgi:negative regulator of flagellin synthesis FlgM